MRLSDTHAELARIHARLRAEGPALVRVDREHPPLSASQQRMWFAHELDPDSAALNVHYAVRLVGPLAVEPLRRALEVIIERHEPLRTIYVQSGGGAAQVVLPLAGWQLPVVDIARLGDEARAAELRRLDREQALARFDLGAGPVVRSRLVRLGATEHVLLLTTHHIASDGWAMGVLWDELVTVYQQVERGEPITLPQLPIRYADFAAWQQRFFDGDELGRRLDWWKQHLAGTATDAALPVDASQRAGAGRGSAHVERRIGMALRKRLGTIGADSGGTLFTTLLAALRVLLARYTGQRDLCIATPVASRHRPEVRRLIGCFINTLAVRSPLDPDQGFHAVVARESRQFLDAYAHHETPFDAVVDALGLPRERGRPPLCQVMFNHLGERIVDGTIAFERIGLQVERLRFGLDTVDFDLALTTREGPDGLDLVFGYDAGRFDAATIDRLASHFICLLEAIASDPGRPVGQLSMLQDGERQALLARGLGAPEQRPAAAIHHMVEAQVDRNPEAIAVRCNGHALTYRQLDERANRLAHHLARAGAGPERPIALLIDRTADMVVSLLAILKTGAAYVAIDPNHPRDRVHAILDDCGAKLVVGDSRAEAAVATRDLTPVWIDAIAAELATEPAARPEVTVDPSNLAYLLYTSGSTGRPKGVQIPHRAVVAFLASMREQPGLGPADVLVAVTTISFDISVLELLLPLTVGASVVVASRDDAMDGSRLRRLLEASAATVMQATPATWRLLIEAGWPSHGRLRALCGGEALAPDLARTLCESAVQVWNMYGPTETTVWSAIARVAPGDPIHLGAAIAGTRIQVLDPLTMELSPIGVPGELFIAGAGLARGYRDLPAMTAERFVPDPYGVDPGERMYRTGDRVRWRADGRLEFLGRTDHQVKVRGFRIELAEIEAVLRRYRAVRECAVVAVAGPDSSMRLVGYVVPSDVDDPASLAPALRDHVAARLPDYMVPSAFVLLAALPLTANRKLDRRALPAPEWSALGEHEMPASPRTPEEEALVGIWTDVLDVDAVGIRDDFFALGGHSLLAMQVVSRVRELFDVDVPVRALLENPTVERLAAQLAELRGDVARLALPPLVPLDRGPEQACSYAQQRMWFLHQLEPESPAYHLRLARRLRGALDIDRLQQAFEQLVRRHEALRTVFPAPDGTPRQRVIEPGPFDLPVDDLSHVPRGRRDAAIADIASAEGSRPFDLAAGPLLRARLLAIDTADHVLIVAMHHIVTDGWSLELFWRELAVLYTALCRGAPPALSPLPVQYADYAAWQRTWLEGDRLAQQLAWWRAQLADAPAETALPVRGPRPREPSHRGATVSLMLDRDHTLRLRDLARRSGSTMFMILVAALRSALYRTTGQTDLCIGTPVANRQHAGIEGLIGLFVNTLVLRTEVTGDLSFLDLLARERDTALEAYAHQDTPFEMIVDALGVERNLDRTPLFQVLFVHQNVPLRPPVTPGLQVEPIELTSTTTKFDLRLSTTEQDGRIRLSLAYREDLFERIAIERMGHHLRRILDEVAVAPERAIGAISMLGPDERRLLLETWNPAPPRDALDRELAVTVCDQFERWASATPAAPALRFEEVVVSYRELDRRANQLAHRLIGAGAGPETVVALVLDRSIEAIVGILGALKAGAAYLPIDPATPVARIAAMIEQAGALLVVTRSSLETLAPAGIDRVLVDAVDPAARADRPRRRVSAENLAYVIFTSGSTGRPKGIGVEHRQLASYLRGLRQRLELEDGWSHATVSSIAADLGNTSILGALCSGGCLHVIAEHRLLDPDAMAGYLASHEVDCLKIVPSHLRALTRSIDPGQLLPRRRLILGGEAAAASWLAEIVQRAGCRVFNHYGPTETTIGVVAGEVPSADALGRTAVVPLGRPMETSRAYCLDEDGQPVPIGAWGELYVGGDNVSRGYVGKPRLTADRFVPDPFSPVPGRTMYRTGDRVRWRSDGTLEFDGRRDDQVKVRGFRIELQEIAATLLELPQVADAAVVAHAGADGDARLVAYVVKADDRLTADMVRRQLAGRLPEHMVPSAFVFIDAVPVTGNGKLDRRRLPDPDQPGAVTELDRPRDPLEEELVAIWSDVLGGRRIGIRDNFFALGGHSLLATQVISRTRTVFGVDLALRTMFEVPTVEGLAREIAALRGHGAHSTAPPITAVPRRADLPCSFSQQRLWFLHQLEEDSAAYHARLPRRLRGRLDREALRQALEQLVARHEALRTVFPDPTGVPHQRILPPARFELPVEDLSAVAPEDRDAELERRLEADARRPFDLAAGPVFRARLFQIDTDDNVLDLTMHHIASDGWSMPVLWRELSALYSALSNGERPALPPLSIQYADYAVWQRQWLVGDVLERQLEHWQARLAGAPGEIDLPFRAPRPPVQTYGGATVTIELGPQLSAQVAELGRRHGVTTFMTLLAGFRLLLARYTGQPDLCIGTPVANRHRAETEGLIGCFVNTLVLRSAIAAGDRFADLLAREKQVALEAYANQDTPFELIADRLGVERSLSRTPVFQVMFIHRHAISASDGFGDLAVEPLQRRLEVAKFDLTLVTWDERGTLSAALRYNTDLFDRATVEQMARHLVRLIAAVCAEPDREVGAIPLLDDQERDRLASPAQSGRDGDVQAIVPVHRAIEQAASATPHAVAVELDADRLSYGELDRRANQIAHALIAAGAAPDRPVAVCFDRSIDWIVCTLGVLKAGAAYLPIAPGLPADRVKAMLRDCGAGLAIAGAPLDDVGAIDVIVLDRDRTAIEGQPVTRPVVAIDGDNLAYILYTSGSTGRPKGVMVSHAAIANEVAAVQRFRIPLDRDAAYLQLAACSFDVSVHEVLWTLTTGARLVLVRDGEQRDPARIVDRLQAHSITAVSLPPALLPTVLDHPGFESCRSLRQVSTGGDALPLSVLRQFAAARPDIPLFNSYGPTETAVNASMWRCDPARSTIAIGVPLRNVALHVLDPELAPVPFGVAGELYIGGVQVARGYAGAPALTAERFLPDPFAAQPGARMYRTGDRVRLWHDGNIEFLGRNDGQVKLRGFRIELGEVESVLLGHPAVQRCAVAVRPVNRQPQLCAYVVAAGAIDTASIRAHLRTMLPDYMIPAVIVGVDQLPMTASGKVDRKRLPEPPDVAIEREEYEPPSSPVEETLAAIWSDILGVDQVGVHDDFFSLGGHSLLATQLVSRIRGLLDVELPLRVVFEQRTVARLAREVERGRAAGAGVVFPIALGTGHRDGRCSPIQERWHRIRDANPAIASLPPFRATMDHTLTGPIDIDRLAVSFAALVRRHGMLRAAFHNDGDRVFQTVVEPSAATAIEVHDLRRGADQEARCDQILRELTFEPFDLTAGRMFRAGVIRIDDEVTRLIFSSDHLVQDGRSQAILFRDLFRIYAALGHDPRAELDAVLAPLVHHYPDWADYQWRLLAGDHAAALRAYWRGRLARAQDLVLPTDSAGTDDELAPAVSAKQVLAEATVADLDRFSLQERMTRPVVLLSVLFSLLHRRTGQTDLCLAVPADARSDEFAPVVGHFTLPLLIRVQIGHRMGFRSLCRAVHDSLLEAYEWRRVPLYAVWAPPRGLWRMAFNYQRRVVTQGANVDRLAIRPTANRLNRRTHIDMDLGLQVGELDRTQIVLYLNGRADRFRPETMQVLVRELSELTTTLTGTPDQPVAAFNRPAAAAPARPRRREPRW